MEGRLSIKLNCNLRGTENIHKLKLGFTGCTQKTPLNCPLSVKMVWVKDWEQKLSCNPT